MRGKLGRKVGSKALETVFRLTSVYPQAHDKTMTAEATEKSKMLVKSKPNGGVCFVGSSTFTFWGSLQEDMRVAGVTEACWNAAFGGSCTYQLLSEVDKLCTDFQPKVIVYFCGTNDINLKIGKPGQNFVIFVDLIRRKLPLARFVYLAATVTPFVVARGDSFVRSFSDLNRDVREVASHAKGIEFVESGDFQQQTSFYLGDNHHLTPHGHLELAKLLQPAVQRALEASSEPVVCTERRGQPST